MRNVVMIGWLGLMLAASGAAAQSTPSPEADLLAVDDQERALVLTDNAAEMERLAHPDLHINAPTNEVLDRTEFLRRLKGKIIAFEKLKRIPEQVFISGDVGIIMGREEVYPTPTSESGQLFGVRTIMRRYTNIYQRVDGRWRFLARHANVVAPPTPPSPTTPPK